MTIHCSVEDLSTLLDAELEERERRRVEAHVERCGKCRARLLELRRVREHLRRLETVEPPPALDWRVRAGVRLEPRRAGLGLRLGDRISTWTKQPVYAPLFALIVALATISYLLSVGVARERHAPTRIIAPPAARSAGEEAPGPAVDERSAAGARRERAVPKAEVAAPPAAKSTSQEAPPPAADGRSAASAGPEPAAPVAGIARAESGEASPTILSLAGRTLEWREGAWWEEGLESSRAPEAAGAIRRDDLPPALGWLAEAPAGSYVVRLDGVATRVELPPAL